MIDARSMPVGWRVGGHALSRALKGSSRAIGSLCLTLRTSLRLVMAVERFVGVEEARPVLGQLAEEAAGGDEVWLTKRGKPLAVLLSREAYTQLRQAAARAGREELAARVAAARRKVAEAGLDPAIVDEAVEAARRSA
jgi:prevent-host-death family protein